MIYIAKTFQGLEEVLATELRDLGAINVVVQKRAVAFEAATGDDALLYRANLCCRTALRILVPLIDFKCLNEEGLYNYVKTVDWENYLTPESTFTIDATVYSEIFKHSRYAVLKTKDAIVDRLRDRLGSRPSIDTENPDLRLHLHIAGAVCSLSMDSSGGSLHLRGYRAEQGEAPLSEVMAAGIVLLSGWKPEENFLDLMCGAGTIPIEAAMIAANIAPNILRAEFGFQRWRSYDAALWQRVRDEARAKERRDVVTDKVHIFASDYDFSVLGKATRNIERAGLSDAITVIRSRLERTEPPVEGGVMIINPPYGERIQPDTENVLEFYKMMGDMFKQRLRGYRIHVLTGNLEAAKHIGLKATRRIPLFNGKIECRLLEYKMY